MVVYRVVFTGGPCGGKSSALEHVSKYLKENGYEVLCIPEVPTIVMSGGGKYPGESNPAKLFHFETGILSLQLSFENSYAEIAKSFDKPVVIIHDRGIMDPKAYMANDTWTNILKQNKWSESDFLKRYDLVVHLVTAADGAEKFYTTTNNSVRSETVEQAKNLDTKVKSCWAKHHNLQAVDNSTDFSGKIKRTNDAIIQMLKTKKSSNEK